MFDLSAYHNGIVVIESLLVNDLHTGRHLYNDIISPICITNGNNWHHQFRTVSSKDDFWMFMGNIGHGCMNNQLSPILHFDMHGHKEKGLWIAATDEYVSWKEFCDLCRNINQECANNLMVVLAVCHGFEAILDVSILETAPFCFLIGAENSIRGGYIERYFPGFYKELLNNKTDRMEQLIHRNLNGRFRFFSAERILCLAFAEYIKERCTKKFRGIRTEYLLTMYRLYRDFPDSAIGRFRRIIRDNIRPTEESYLDLKKRFLMSDAPENEERFAFDYEDVKAYLVNS